jgi:membrane-bound ClpP family serine protease
MPQQQLVWWPICYSHQMVKYYMNTAAKNSYRKPMMNFKANENNEFTQSLNKGTTQLSQPEWELTMFYLQVLCSQA